LEKLCEIKDFILLKGWEAFADGLWPLNEPSYNTNTPLLERGLWGHDLHLHGFLFLLLFKLTINLILEVFSFPCADCAVIIVPLVVVNLRGGKSGNSGYSEPVREARTGQCKIGKDMVQRKSRQGRYCVVLERNTVRGIGRVRLQ